MANRLYRSQFLYSFQKDMVSLQGKFDVVANVFATVTAQGITYTSVLRGTAGNAITVTLTGGATAGAEVVTVSGTAITVQIENGVSTRTQVKTAIDASVAAAALVSVSVTSGGTAVNTAAAVTLTGGVDGVVTGWTIPGVASIANSGAGEYTITLQDTYNALLHGSFTVLAATATDKVPQMKSQSINSAKTVVFSLLAGATPTEVNAAASIYFQLLLKNTSL